ncbi:MAG: hypothetical protein OXF02_00575 [Simkaniaceae bacterium]|nr:hypothetical protein [Simkaniaceae bacterium]
MEHPELANHLATGWLGIEAVANPHHDGSPYVWDPKSYPASNLRELATHLKQISDLAIDNMDEVSRLALTHERDRYLQYDALVEPFLAAWGLHQFSLKEVLRQIEDPHSQVWKQVVSQAEKRMSQINERVAEIRKKHNFHTDASLEQLKHSFYKENERIFLEGMESHEWDRTPSMLRFFQCVFVLEREGLVSEETRLLGRSLAQCDIAYQIADDILHKEGVATKALLELVHKIGCHYETVQRAPKSLVHGNAHPHEFLQDKGGNWTLGGCESLYVGCIYRDIAQEYVRKLVRDYLRGDTDRGETLEKIQAVLIPGWFDAFWPDIMGYCVIEFAQELETLFFAYSMDAEKVDFLNLTITPGTYLKEMRERLAFEACYRNKLFPLLNTP